MRRCLMLTVLAAASLTWVVSAQPEEGRTFAFLVACGDYDPTELKPVPFTLHEMKLFRDALLATGVSEKNIVYLHDKTDKPGRFIPNRANILAEYKLLLERLRPEDSLIVALSGHGIQYKADAAGYFCPLDAKLGPNRKQTLLALEGDEGLLTLLEKSKAQRKLVVVNACRNDPASSAFLAAEKLDLRDDYAEEPPRGTVVLFACGKGQRSYFYPETEKREERRNRSLFMYHLTEAWTGRYAAGKKVTLDHVLTQVRDRVEEDAPHDFRNNQMPLVKRKSFEGSWTLADRPAPHINSIGMKLVYIPPGTFRMGSPASEPDRREDETLHDVEITRGFYLGAFEVTQEEYQKVMGKNPSYFRAGGDGSEQVADIDTKRFPVERVSWEEAREFCEKLMVLEAERAAPNPRRNRDLEEKQARIAEANFELRRRAYERAKADIRMLSTAVVNEIHMDLVRLRTEHHIAQARLHSPDSLVRRNTLIAELEGLRELEMIWRGHVALFKEAGTTISKEEMDNLVLKANEVSKRLVSADADLQEINRSMKLYRLPTEAEWEYACRAGATTAYHIGDTLTEQHATFRSLSPQAKKVARPTPVGSFAPNAWGLHDMHGNVWEWCSDWYDPKFYAKSGRKDPQNGRDAEYRVVRGGSWSDVPRFCRSGSRGLYSNIFVDNGYVGFRVVLTIPQ